MTVITQTIVSFSTQSGQNSLKLSTLARNHKWSSFFLILVIPFPSSFNNWSLTNKREGHCSRKIYPRTVRRSRAKNSQVVFLIVMPIIWFGWFPICKSTTTHNPSIQPIETFPGWISSTWAKDRVYTSN